MRISTLFFALSLSACYPEDPQRGMSDASSEHRDAGGADDANYLCTPNPAQTGLSGTLEGVGVLLSGSDAGQQHAITVRIDTSTDAEQVHPGREISIYLTPQQAVMLREPPYPAYVLAAGIYSPACEGFYNWGRPCFPAGACVQILY